MWVTLRLVFGVQMGLEWDLQPSFQLLDVQEGLQVKLQFWFISSRLKAEQTSPAGCGQASTLHEHSMALLFSFHASGSIGEMPSPLAPANIESLILRGKRPGTYLPKLLEKRSLLAWAFRVTRWPLSHAAIPSVVRMKWNPSLATSTYRSKFYPMVTTQNQFVFSTML